MRESYYVDTLVRPSYWPPALDCSRVTGHSTASVLALQTVSGLRNSQARVAAEPAPECGTRPTNMSTLLQPPLPSAPDRSHSVRSTTRRSAACEAVVLAPLQLSSCSPRLVPLSSQRRHACVLFTPGADTTARRRRFASPFASQPVTAMHSVRGREFYGSVPHWLASSPTKL